VRIDKLARKARLEALSEDKDICTLLFDHEKPRQACRLFLDWLRENGNRASRHEVSQFGRDLQEGEIEEGFTYCRWSFYRTVLKRLVNLGFMELFTGYHKGRRQQVYAPIIQPIPARPPGGRNFWNMAWQICERWNNEWEW
jgi:hypothetical protein